ncbi:MAG: restriction endonuclease subunit S [Rubrivivax sp.]|jgi:type I restriction enzyme S subunit|nr:restriction endonuclease subunit S [Rubrivivax sp.]
MSSEWPLVSIDNIKATRSGSIAIGPFGSRMKSDCYVSNGVRVVRGTNLTGGRSFSGDFVFITPEKAEELNSANLLPNDLVFPHRGAIGEVGIVPNDGERYVLSSSMMKLTCAADGAHPDFIYYFFKSEAGRFELLKNASQVGTPGIGQPLTSLKQIKLKLPPVDEQRSIAAALRALDDRIALLRETNATLEAIAQALFKSWFVDFDPVRAKQQGLAPAGLDEATAALFPDSFEESALGLVPKGWSVQPVGDAVECVGGATPDTKDPSYWSPEEHAWTTPKDLSGLPAPVLLSTERRLSTKGVAKIGSGLLPVGTLLMSSRAPIGYLAIAQVPLAINQGYIAMPPGSLLPPLYMLFWCRQNMEGIKARANGSTFMEISKKAFRPIPALVPSSPAIKAFLAVASPLFARLVSNEQQAQSLATIRDTLLPRLISGQLRLPEALVEIEEAA